MRGFRRGGCASEGCRQAWHEQAEACSRHAAHREQEQHNASRKAQRLAARRNLSQAGPATHGVGCVCLPARTHFLCSARWASSTPLGCQGATAVAASEASGSPTAIAACMASRTPVAGGPLLGSWGLLSSMPGAANITRDSGQVWAAAPGILIVQQPATWPLQPARPVIQSAGHLPAAHTLREPAHAKKTLSPYIAVPYICPGDSCRCIIASPSPAAALGCSTLRLARATRCMPRSAAVMCAE